MFKMGMQAISVRHISGKEAPTHDKFGMKWISCQIRTLWTKNKPFSVKY